MNILAEIKAERLAQAVPILHEINGQNQKLFVIYPAADVMDRIQKKHGYSPLTGGITDVFEVLAGEDEAQFEARKAHIRGVKSQAYLMDLIYHCLCDGAKKPWITDEDSYNETVQYVSRNEELLKKIDTAISDLMKTKEAQPDPIQAP